MDFQFTCDYLGKPLVRCSMDHEAVAAWINSEIDGDWAKLDAVFNIIEQAKQHAAPHFEQRLEGREFFIVVNAEEVMVQANNLSFACDDMIEDGFGYYDQESLAFCGLEDFERLLLQYRDFIKIK
ncbi:UPF0231 family protein [Testudinibacter sp. TR-2022]|uniref:UPF0231 family protein n=1 Tax=Testudinibacter sp. TR-2022 TaxID=2585029 RepID=UPI00111A35A8|nr:YacL family protein [Testudinibacter sp. TR-2022]TNH04805.1 UPF0231 family protein [Pasteurellaceae bacterium Phil31]TNH07048.1 UPF0231 family protein [Testudinibacter sp. TR-2022]TNH08547.1 UPF0231 family protein [Testudinibacter sp. TR-2022]TNH16437.1 UPF0231 family protein [Testudinibacter sp. TR-2022]TNH18401.1 UPF0231 family protein [Testudinibacter sp. TR-2022]